MKGSTILIIGGIVAVGFVAYEIYKHCQFSNNNHFDGTNSSEKSNKRIDENGNPSSDSNISDLVQTKENVVTSIKGTHEEAAKVIKESLDTIYDDKTRDDVETENSESLDKIGNDLDTLLT